MNDALVIDLPENFDPIQFLIDDKKRFLHDLARSCPLASPSIEAEQIVNVIIEAGFTIANRCFLYRSLQRNMPDEISGMYLNALIQGMVLLYRAAFDLPVEEQRNLAEYREEFKRLIDAVLLVHSTLIDYLETTKTQ